MHKTTRGENLFEKFLLAMHKIKLLSKKLSGLTTDGAPAMVGSPKGLTALAKKEMTRRGLAADDVAGMPLHHSSTKFMCKVTSAPSCHVNSDKVHQVNQRQRRSCLF